MTIFSVEQRINEILLKEMSDFNIETKMEFLKGIFTCRINLKDSNTSVSLQYVPNSPITISINTSFAIESVISLLDFLSFLLHKINDYRFDYDFEFEEDKDFPLEEYLTEISFFKNRIVKNLSVNKKIERFVSVDNEFSFSLSVQEIHYSNDAEETFGEVLHFLNINRIRYSYRYDENKRQYDLQFIFFDTLFTMEFKYGIAKTIFVDVEGYSDVLVFPVNSIGELKKSIQLNMFDHLTSLTISSKNMKKINMLNPMSISIKNAFETDKALIQDKEIYGFLYDFVWVNNKEINTSGIENKSFVLEDLLLKMSIDDSYESIEMMLNDFSYGRKEIHFEKHWDTNMPLLEILTTGNKVILTAELIYDNGSETKTFSVEVEKDFEGNYRLTDISNDI